MMSKQYKPLFGDPSWFKLSRGRIQPVTTRGWMLLVGWTLGLLAPTAGFLLVSKHIEAVIWFAFAGLLFLREKRGLSEEKRRENVFLIDEDTDVTTASTSNYDLELRRN